MAARKSQAAETQAAETPAAEAPVKAVVGNLGIPSVGKREPVVEDLPNKTKKVTF